MSIGLRARLTLVHGIRKLALREKLMEQAKVHFPIHEGASDAEAKRIESLRTRWIEARIALNGLSPKVRIGTDQPALFQRRLPGAKFK